MLQFLNIYIFVAGPGVLYWTVKSVLKKCFSVLSKKTHNYENKSHMLSIVVYMKIKFVMVFLYLQSAKSKTSIYTAQKMKFSIKDFFSKYDQIHSFLRIWSHLLKKSLIESFIFCSVLIHSVYPVIFHWWSYWCPKLRIRTNWNSEESSLRW